MTDIERMRAWYAANEQWLATQPLTEFVAAAAWKAGRADALEEAAKAAEAQIEHLLDRFGMGAEVIHSCEECAAAIRALPHSAG